MGIHFIDIILLIIGLIGSGIVAKIGAKGNRKQMIFLIALALILFVSSFIPITIALINS